MARVSLLYSGVIAWIKTYDAEQVVKEEKLTEQEAVFVEKRSVSSPWYFLFTLGLVVLIYRFRFAKKSL